MSRPTKITVCAGACDENGTKPKCGNCGVQIETELTDAEIAEMEARAAQIEINRVAREAEVAAVAEAKASAQAKLAALGLTLEEIAAL